MPYSYVSFINDKILLYNTKTGSNLETSHEKNIALIKSIYDRKSLGVAFLSKEDLKDINCFDFIKEICNREIGSVNEVNTCEEKPISLVPILNLQRDVEKLRKNKNSLIGENVLGYLTNLNIYINSVCEQVCTYCKSYLNQLNCCSKNQHSKHLDINTLSSLIQQLDFSSLNSIQILGGNSKWTPP